MPPEPVKQVEQIEGPPDLKTWKESRKEPAAASTDKKPEPSAAKPDSAKPETTDSKPAPVGGDKVGDTGTPKPQDKQKPRANPTAEERIAQLTADHNREKAERERERSERERWYSIMA